MTQGGGGGGGALHGLYGGSMGHMKGGETRWLFCCCFFICLSEIICRANCYARDSYMRKGRLTRFLNMSGQSRRCEKRHRSLR